jgi:hypothetical protein
MTSSPSDQQLVLPWLSAANRYIRTTKFPRIGRSMFDSEESASIVDLNSGSSSSEEKNDDDNDDVIEKRSVLFPRIGKRAFHNLLWANARSNPHRMIDAQGRSYLNGYDHNMHQARPASQSRYRGKRNVQM